VQGGSCGTFGGSCGTFGGRDGGAGDSKVVRGNGGAPGGGAGDPLKVLGRRTSRICEVNHARARDMARRHGILLGV
jgi:hypothetical protein